MTGITARHIFVNMKFKFDHVVLGCDMSYDTFNPRGCNYIKNKPYDFEKQIWPIKILIV